MTGDEGLRRPADMDSRPSRMRIMGQKYSRLALGIVGLSLKGLAALLFVFEAASSSDCHVHNGIQTCCGLLTLFSRLEPTPDSKSCLEMPPKQPSGTRVNSGPKTTA